MVPRPRTIGLRGTPVDTISFGIMSLGHAYGDAGDTPTRLKILDEIYKQGITTWDDADIYGDTEDLVGEWLTANPERRKEIFLATKCGITPDGFRSDPEYIKQACDKSLSRLKTDHIDLYYIHRVDQKTPIEKTMEALVELKKQGKIRYIGLSEVSARTLIRACKIEHVDALQTEYSPFALDIEKSKPGEKSILNVCKEHNITIFAYSPLGRGFLTGTIKSPEDLAGDWRGTVPTFAKEAFHSNMELVKAIAVVTAEVQKSQPNATQAQVVLAWLLRQWDGVVPLFGSKNPARAKENIEAVNVELSDEEIKAIREASESLKKVGERYPGMFTSSVDADTPEL